MAVTVAEAGTAIKPPMSVPAGAGSFAAFDLVCACLSPVGPVPPPGTDIDPDLPDLIARVARRHQVSGLVAARLAQAGQAVPAPLARQAQIAQQRALRQLALTLDLGDALAAAGIDAVFLKGLTLSQRAFGSPLLRSAVDIDVLIGRDQVEPAWQLLERIGLTQITPAHPLTGARLGLFCRASKDSIHQHRASRSTVELHWRMADELARPGLPPAPERTQVELAPGRRVPVLEDRAQFLFLCTHGAAHGWARLKWLADVAALLHGSPDRGTALWTYAVANGGAVPAASAILLAQELFGLAPPPGFAAPRSLRLRLLMRMARTAVRAGHGALELEATHWRGWTEMLAKVLVAATWRGRLAVLRRLALAGEDVAAVALPARLFWLYPVLRVPLLVRRRLARARRLHARRGEDNTAP